MANARSRNNSNGIPWRMPEVLALILGVTAIITPMWQAISGISGRVTELAAQINQVRGVEYPAVLTDLASMKVQFTEIETQFRNLNERTQRMESSFAGNMHSLDEKLQLEISAGRAEMRSDINPHLAVLDEQVKALKSH